MYAEKFNFKKYVQFRHEVVSVVQAPDFEETGRWVVRTRNLDTNEVKDQTFDGVQVCSGHHGTVNQPKLKGEEKFKGTIYHTHSLKNAKGFEDKNVVVVGIGNSGKIFTFNLLLPFTNFSAFAGGDAAVELSVVAKQVGDYYFLLF